MLSLFNATSTLITAVDDWTRPKHVHHWKDGRSAKELAKAWCPGSGSPRCPEIVQALLDTHPLSRGASLIEGRPEHVTPLPERGEGRNHDLWIRAEAARVPLTICVEAKADEPFADSIGDYLQRARTRNPKTGSARRARQLIQIVFGQHADPESAPYAGLRYQLLTAAAGTVLQAVRDGADRAVLIVHEFRSDEVDPRKLQANDNDLRAFLQTLSDGAAELQNGKLVGPWRMKVEGASPAHVDLLIGKVVTVCSRPLDPMPQEE